MTAHTPTPWMLNPSAPEEIISPGETLVIVRAPQPYLQPRAKANAELIVRAVNAHDDLVAAAKAAVRYDEAIRACANDPKRMASFCTAEGDDLDALYEAWQAKSQAALVKSGAP
jgi:hypothetical protein